MPVHNEWIGQEGGIACNLLPLTLIRICCTAAIAAENAETVSPP